MDWPTLKREVDLRTSRSSGSGGQHVNKVDSRVELIFNPASSDALSEEEKAWLQHHLGKRLTAGGDLIVSSQAERSQHLNRRRAWQKLENLLKSSLHPPRPPRRAKAFKASRKKRLEDKRRRSEVKAQRQNPRW